MAQSKIEWTELTWNPVQDAQKFHQGVNSVMQKLCRGD